MEKTKYALFSTKLQHCFTGLLKDGLTPRGNTPLFDLFLATD